MRGPDRTSGVCSREIQLRRSMLERDPDRMRHQRLALSVVCAFLALTAMPRAPAAEDVITLGAAVSQTGEFSRNGLDTKHGYDLAVAKVNEEGGIHVAGRPRKLAIRYYDDQSVPSRGTELAERLIRQDGVAFMLGPSHADMTKAILPVIEKYGVPMVEGNSATRDLFSQGYTNIFAVTTASDQYLSETIELAADNAGKLGKRPEEITVALAVEGDGVGQDVRSGVFDEIEARGMRVVIDDQLPPELDDLSATLAKVKALKPDLLIVSGREGGAIAAVKATSAMRVDVPMLAITHCEPAHLAETLAVEGEHVLCPVQWHPTLPYRDEWFGSAADFARAYRAAYGAKVPFQAAEAAAAVLVFADAFARSDSLERDTVREALRHTERETFFGRIKFDPSGRNVGKPMVLTELRGGEYVVVRTRSREGEQAVIPRPSH